MALRIVTKKITFGDGSPGDAYFATDELNFFPVSVLADSDGALIATTSGIPITVSALPLPTGAATAIGQPTAAGQSSLTASQTGTLMQGAVTSTAPSYSTLQTNPLSLTTVGALRIDGSAVTQPISAATLPLPSGAATAAGLTAINATLGTPMQQTGGFVTANAGTNLNTAALALEAGNLATIANIVSSTQGSTTAGQKGPLTQGAVTTAAPTYTTAQTSPLSLTTAGALRTDASATTQPISGTVTANAGIGTMAVSAATLPLPSGAATSALQPTAAAQGSTTSGQTGHLMQAAVATAAPTYTTAQTSPLSLTTAGGLRVDGSGVTQPVSATSLPLPAGAATASAQASILAAVSAPLAAQVGTVIIGGVQATAIAGGFVDGWDSTKGTIADSAWSGIGSGTQIAVLKSLPLTQASTTSGQLGVLSQATTISTPPTYTAGQTNPICVDTVGNLRINVQAASTGSGNLAQGSTTSGQNGRLVLAAVTTAAPSYTTAQTSPLSLTTAGALRTDGSTVIQPISAASLPLPSGAATAAKQPALGTAGSSSADVITVQGAGGMTALKTDGSGATQPVSAVANAFADNAIATIGSVADTAWSGTGNATLVALGKAFHADATSPVPGAVTAAAPSYTTGTTQAFSLTTAGELRVNVASLPLSAGAATSANQATNAAQGSTTLGQTGFLIQGAVSTSLPAYSDAQTSPISIDRFGNLRVCRGTVASLPSSQPVVTSGSVYAAGNCLGTKLTLTYTITSAEIQELVLYCKSVQTTDIKAWIFHTDPSSSTFTDKSAPVIAAADYNRLLKVVTLTGATSGLGTHTLWSVENLGVRLGASTCFIVLTAVGAPTFGSTSDLFVRAVLKL